jgi:hypothetical protein
MCPLGHLLAQPAFAATKPTNSSARQCARLDVKPELMLPSPQLRETYYKTNIRNRLGTAVSEQAVRWDASRGRDGTCCRRVYAARARHPWVAASRARITLQL